MNLMLYKIKYCIQIHTFKYIIYYYFNIKYMSFSSVYLFWILIYYPTTYSFCITTGILQYITCIYIIKKGFVYLARKTSWKPIGKRIGWQLTTYIIFLQKQRPEFIFVFICNKCKNYTTCYIQNRRSLIWWT